MTLEGFWTDLSGVTHGLTHVNKEKLAARTECGAYVDMRRGDFEAEGAVTCIACVGAPVLTPGDAISAKLSVNMRALDHVRRCQTHLVHKHADGGCLACGYPYEKQPNDWDDDYDEPHP